MTKFCLVLVSSSQIQLDGIETGVLLSDFAQQLRRKIADVPDLYFTLLDAVGIALSVVLNKNARSKKEEGGPLSKNECQKLQRMYTHDSPAFGSVRKLVKTSNLSVSNVRQFLHSKPSNTKLTPAARKLKKMKAFARFKNETRCIDLAYVDKLHHDNNGQKYLLVPRSMFDGTVDAKEMKPKVSTETARSFLTLIIKKNRSKKLWIDKGTQFAGKFKKFYKASRLQIYSTISETKAAFAERTM